MKKTIAIVLLIALAFRPSYYVSQLVYYGLNINYIIEKYCVNKDKPELHCNGKCHLAKQLEVIDTKNNTATLNNLNLLEAFFPIFNTTNSYFFTEVMHLLKVKNKFIYNNNYSFLFCKQDLRPPTVII